MNKLKINSAGVPCPCPICGGAKVTNYIRSQHIKRYVRCGNQGGETSTAAAMSGPTQAADHESDELVHDQSGSSSELESSDESNSQLGGSCELQEPACSNLGAESLDGQRDSEIQQGISGSSQLLSKEPESNSSPLYNMSAYESPIVTEPLYNGASITLLETVVEHLLWFAEHPGISKEALSNLLHVQHHRVLPPGNILPENYEAAMKLVEPFLITPVVFHVCPNDCIIFRGKHAHLDQCPRCHLNRFITGTVPAKRFTYLPIGPRLERMFGTPNLSEIVQSHCSRSDGNLYDIHDSKVWERSYSAQGLFAGDLRGIAFALCTDGVNPYSQNRTSYSMWPIVMTVLNLPRHIRYLPSSLYLVGIIPGNGTKEPNSLQPYLEIVVDEILSLSSRSMYDAYREAPFSLKVDILYYTLDYPGIGKVFNTMGSGAYQACVWCDLNGTRVSALDKVVYLQNRRYLAADSQMRMDTTNFPEKCAEQQPPPTQRVYSTLKTHHVSYDNAKNKSRASMIAKATGCKSSYALMKLPHHDRVTQVFPDAMHTIKDAMVHVFNVMVGSEDSEKVRNAEGQLGRFGITSERPLIGTKRKRKSSCDQRLPAAPFRLSEDDIKVANERVASVILPSHDFTPSCIFSKTSGLKSHDWKELICKGVLKYSLREMLGPEQRSSLFRFLDALTQLYSEKHDKLKLSELRVELNVALALMERDFPVSIQVITMHLLHHIVDGIELYGPVYSTWMFAYERFNSWITRRVKNRRHPEATVMETYRIYEWCQYMVSKRQAVSTPVCNINPADHDATIKLTDEEISLLDAMYTIHHPRYSCLRRQYSEALRRAANARKKSTFPCLVEWVPPGGYQDGDRELLQATLNSMATSHKRMTKECPNTGRKIVHCAASFESPQSRHSYAYVQVKPEADTEPVFGHIQKLITHQFGDRLYAIAIVKLFEDAHKDSDCGLWFVNTAEFHMAAILLKDVSQPLAVAFDSTTLWFLNV